MPSAIWSRLSPRLAGDGDWRPRSRVCGGFGKQTTGIVIGIGADQRYQFADALGRLLERPVVAQAHDEGCHLGVRPLE